MRAKMIDCCDCLVKIALSLRVRWHCERHLIDPPIDFFEARRLIYSQAMSTPNDVVRSKSDPKGSRRMCELEPYQTVAYSIAEVSGTMACQPQATATATTIQFSQFSHVCLSSFSPLSPSPSGARRLRTNRRPFHPHKPPVQRPSLRPRTLFSILGC